MDDATAAAIALRAFELFEARGRRHGEDRGDWFAAEMEILEDSRLRNLGPCRTELQLCEVPNAFIQSALAFLDAAETLNTLMLQNKWASNSQRGNVVLWLSFHGSELFCKGCISQLQPGCSVTGHSLATLVEQLESLAPGAQFVTPFEIEVLPGGPGSRELRQKEHKRIHERLRYPTDNSGQPWPGVSVFSSQLFAADLTNLRAGINRVYLKIFGRDQGSK